MKQYIIEKVSLLAIVKKKMKEPEEYSSAGIFSDSWRSLSIWLGICLLCLLTIAIIIITLFSYTSDRASDSNREGIALETQASAFETQITSSISVLNAAIDSVNNSLSEDIWELMDALNMTTADGQSIAQQLLAQVAALEAVASMKIATINNIYGDTTMHNINFIGFGITVNPRPSVNYVELINDGVITVASTDNSMLLINVTDQIVYIENKCIKTINDAPSALGNIDLIGLGMIVIVPDTMANSVTIDGSALSTVLMNAQITANAQSLQIAALEAAAIGLQQQTDGLQMSADMLYDIINATGITFNSTLEELIDRVAALMARRDQLQQDIDQLQVDIIPRVGSIIPWGGAEIVSNTSAIPERYLLCDGTQVAIVDYPDLYDVIGLIYCNSNCTTGLFAVPDLRGSIPVGQSPSGYFTGAVGTAVGEEAHELSISEMGAHAHNGFTSQESPVHVHQFGISLTNAAIGPCVSGGPIAPNTNYLRVDAYAGYPTCPSGPCHGNGLSFSLGGQHTHDMSVYNQGGSVPHNNIQPSIVIQYLIRAER